MGGDLAMKKKVQRKFKMRGFTLKVGVLDEVLSFLSRFPDEEYEALDILIDEIDKGSSESSIFDKEAVQRVVSVLLDAQASVDPTAPAGSSRTALRVIDAFVVPKFHYDPIKNVFYEHTGRLPIHGEAHNKASLYGDRYQLLLQRLSRDKYFSRPAFATESLEDENCEITAIQSLIGCKGRRWIMGVISQLEERQFYLEDLTAAVPIDLTNTISFRLIYHSLYVSRANFMCFFAENTVIVAEGELQPNGIFQVNTCGFPPIEDRETSLSLLRGLDFFGAGTISPEETVRLSELEERSMTCL
ncbi:hypothetical protein LUZ60_011440 [Juncus effusus]|nr:hypothetical protein LUZ60_011440 [Juncus effusus]